MTSEVRDKLLDQLRNKYEKAGEKYGKKFFDMAQLESRITHLIQTGMDVENFLTQEMQFYLKTEAMAEQKLEDKKRKDELNRKIDAMMAANEEKIEKYPDVFFDPAASNEIRRLVGAITQWMKLYYPVVEKIFRGATVWTQLNTLIGELERFNVPAEYSPTVLLRHYIDQLKTLGPHYREKVERKLMQTASLALYRVEKILADEYRYVKEVPASTPMSFPGYEEEIRIKWHNKPENQALSETLDYTSGVIDDFRLRDLVAHGDRAEALKSSFDSP